MKLALQAKRGGLALAEGAAKNIKIFKPVRYSTVVAWFIYLALTSHVLCLIQPVPKQDNGCDCGIFTIKNCTQILEKRHELTQLPVTKEAFLEAFKMQVLQEESYSQADVTNIRTRLKSAFER